MHAAASQRDEQRSARVTVVAGACVRRALGVLALPVALGACGPSVAPRTSPEEATVEPAVGAVDPSVATAPPEVNTAFVRSIDWLAAHLDRPDLVVLHADRDRASFDEAHIPGARFLALEAIAVDHGVPLEVPRSTEQLVEAFREVGVTDRSHVVLYGGLGGLAPARAFFTLDVLGHGASAALLDGNIEAWTRAGHPVSSERPEPLREEEGTLTRHREPERIVDAEWVRAHLDDPSVLLIDVRSPEEFSGEEGEGPRRGHIPGARHLYWEELLADRKTQRLRDSAELRAMFEEIGARADRTNVIYCTIGLRASFAYFVSRYLGYDTKMYDGSFYDWSRREDLPVER